MPLVKLLEQVRIHLEEIECRRVRQRGGFHETQKQKEIVELGGLLSQFVFVATERDTVHELSETVAKFRELVGPIHTLIISRTVYS